MKINILKSLSLGAALLMICGASYAQTEQPMAQGQDPTSVAEGNELVIQSLFEYVVAPDSLPDLQSRTDYVVVHFWDPFDFENSGIVDQNALHHAFRTYAEAMPYASSEKVIESVDNLVGKIKGNAALSFQFLKAAEDVFYGRRAEYWADELYKPFLQNFLDNSSIDESRKQRYRKQLATIERTEMGAPFPSFNWQPLPQSSKSLDLNNNLTLVGFFNLQDDDLKYPLLRLDISGTVNNLIADKKLAVYLVGYGADTSGKDALKDEKNRWNAGVSSDAPQVMDIRMSPSFYVVDGNKKIIAKNVTLDKALDLLKDLSTPQ